ncbi:MFS transporter [Sphingobium sp. Sx8-8]|uniref:MFS transporter n=1 Tax=Sphingobium sp. Sx8-8 TaxID=2933617 RepID=UPI001F566A68|nr:MFS transporter [Sphingobium sp. Sx8-8]
MVAVQSQAAPHGALKSGRTAYPYYVLALLTFANFFNYLDRQLISILAESLKADLGLDDAQLGFLYGTLFAALYSIFGLSVGRLADNVSQPRLLGVGLALWSGMTALSGFAFNFASLAMARLGVGVGEATANPCSHALIAEYFPVERRASAYAIYLAAIYLGGGASLVIGGYILQHWVELTAEFGVIGALRPWQGAFLLAGFPGVILAVLIFFIRDPRRTTGILPVSTRPWAEFLGSLMDLTPVFSLLRRGAPVARTAAITLAIAAVVALLCWLTGQIQQWLALGLVVFAMLGFALRIRANDGPLFTLTFGTRSFRWLVSGMAITACIQHATLFWAVPYAMRVMHMAPGAAGGTIGIILAVGGGGGVILGGIVGDRLRRRHQSAAAVMTLGSLGLSVPLALVAFTTADIRLFLIALWGFAFVQNCWSPSAAAVVQELVLPRMRATGAATFSMLIIVVTLACGPYLVGVISEVSGSLSAGVLALYALTPFAVALLLAGVRTVASDIASKGGRAAKAGEPQTDFETVKIS